MRDEAGPGAPEVDGEAVRRQRQREEQQDDVRLVAAVASGDREALAALYDRHGGLLLALGLRVLRERTAAEDVLHDVFLEAWHQAGTFDPARGTVRGWLVMRMRSRVLDRKAQAVRRARLTEEAMRETDWSEGTAAGAAGGGSQLDQQRVQRGVGALPADLAAVIELAYFKGLSSSEIAEQMGIPVGTVKSRMARALATLREHLVAGKRGEGA